jgi:hypothetical protein
MSSTNSKIDSLKATSTTKHGIIHLNLSWKTAILECTKIHIKTLNFDGIAAVKSLASQLIGVVTKTCLCAKYDINNIDHNPK